MAGKSTPLSPKTVIAVADRLNEQFSRSDYSAVISSFDEALKVILSEDQLKQTWEVALQRNGNPRLQHLASGIVSSKDHYDAVVTFLEFEKSRYGLLVIVDTLTGKISDLCPLPLIDADQ